MTYRQGTPNGKGAGCNPVGLMSIACSSHAPVIANLNAVNVK